MTQEVQVILTLEVYATKSKEDIKAFFRDMEETYTRSVSQRNRFEFPKLTMVDVREEAEIYQTNRSSLNNERAVLNLQEKGISAKEENDTVYIIIGDVELELAQFEIEYQARDYYTLKTNP